MQASAVENQQNPTLFLNQFHLDPSFFHPVAQMQTCELLSRYLIYKNHAKDEGATTEKESLRKNYLKVLCLTLID